MQDKENEQFFILQSILNTDFVLYTTWPRPFLRPKEDVSLWSEKKLLLKIEFNPRLQSF